MSSTPWITALPVILWMTICIISCLFPSSAPTHANKPGSDRCARESA